LSLRQAFLRLWLHARNRRVRAEGCRKVTVGFNTPVTEFQRLADDPDTVMRFGVATNPHTSPAVLQKMADN
jgi:hypothetical protein